MFKEAEIDRGALVLAVVAVSAVAVLTPAALLYSLFAECKMTCLMKSDRW